MDNQYRKVTGYRELNQNDVDLMNECKALETQCAALVKKLQDYKPTSIDHPAIDQRCVALAKTNLQQGFMWLVRSIAQPGGWE